MADVCSVMDDPRTIESVWTENMAVAVGIGGTTRIECYREAGQCGYVPWFAVYYGDFLAMRLSGQIAQVTYAYAEPTANVF